MNNDRIDFIKKLHQEGKTFEEIRQAATEQGYSTDGLRELYDQVISDRSAPLSESKSHVPHPQDIAGSAAGDQPTAAVTLPSVTDFVRFSFRRFIDRKDVVAPALGVVALGFSPFIILFGYVLVQLVNAGVPLSPTDEFDPVIFGLINWPLAIALFGLGIITTIVSNVLNSGALMYVFGRYSEKHTFSEGLHWAWQNILSLIWIGFLVTAAMLGGLPFLIIPGFIIAFYTIFAQLVLATENQRGNSALVRSTHLISGAFGGILGRLLVLWLVLMVVSSIISTIFQIVLVSGPSDNILSGISMFILQIISTVIQFIIGWIGLTGTALILEYRRASKPEFTLGEHNRTLWFYRIFVGIGSLLIAALIGLMVAGIAYGLADLNQFSSPTINLDDEWYLEEPNSN